jgi:hypothetical protein
MNSASVLYIHADSLAMKLERAGRSRRYLLVNAEGVVQTGPISYNGMTVGQLHEAPSKYTY